MIALSPSLRPSPNATSLRMSRASPRAIAILVRGGMRALEAVMQETEAPEHEALDLIHLERRGGPGLEPNSESQRRASSSVRMVPSPCRIAALVRMFAVVRSGYAEYQQPVGICWRRAQRLKRSPSRRAVHEEVRRLRKAYGVGPHTGQAGMRLGDEVFEIALPAAAVVRQEQQVAACSAP